MVIKDHKLLDFWQMQWYASDLSTTLSEIKEPKYQYTLIIDLL